jgi:hypothetical protein
MRTAGPDDAKSGMNNAPESAHIQSPRNLSLEYGVFVTAESRSLHLSSYSTDAEQASLTASS